MYHPTGRVLTVLEILQLRPGISGPELASRLEVDVRTVRRYIEKIEDLGIPVEALPGRYGGYRLAPGYKLPPLVFTEDEAHIIVLGLIGTPWLELDHSPATVAAAISKITRVLPESARQKLHALSELMVLPDRTDAARPTAALLIELSEAIQSLFPVEITYVSEKLERTTRVVEPYGVVGRRGRWYLVAFCRLRQGYRTFRLDRIEYMETLGVPFFRDEDFDFRRYAEEQLESFNWGTQYTIDFMSSPEEVRAKIGPTTGRLESNGGRCRLTASSDDFDYEARYLAGVGVPFTVVEPPELTEAVLRLAKQLETAAVNSVGAPGQERV
jgi:predicted DNA-binding transcriptional regulator YafY